MENDTQEFSYSYSSNEQKEIEKIKEKYQKKEETKLEKLRRLDKSVTTKATAFSISVGVAGALILGTGMSLIMTDLAQILSMTTAASIIFGLIFGILGIAGIVLSYPLYKAVLRREREKIAPEILKLTDELMK